MTVLCLNMQAEDLSIHLDLSGTWQFALDREGTMKADDAMTETVMLPGTTDTNKKEISSVKQRRRHISPVSMPTRVVPGIGVL